MNSLSFPSKSELAIISQSVSEISDNILSNISKEKMMFVIDTNEGNRNPNIFLISKYLTETLKIISKKDQIYSGGLYFGFFKGGKLLISLEGAEFLYKKGIFLKESILIVNDDAEKAILYGNKISKKMLLEFPKISRKQLYIVLNSRNEVIALAKLLIDLTNLEKLKPTDIIAINLVDKGYYLRKEQ